MNITLNKTVFNVTLSNESEHIFTVAPGNDSRVIIDANPLYGVGGAMNASWGGIGGTITDQVDLVEALEGKADSGHNHDLAYEPKNTNIQPHISDPAIHMSPEEKSLLGTVQNITTVVNPSYIETTIGSQTSPKMFLFTKNFTGTTGINELTFGTTNAYVDIQRAADGATASLLTVHSHYLLTLQTSLSGGITVNTPTLRFEKQGYGANKFLCSDATGVATFTAITTALISDFPTQTGNSGKVLSTNGTNLIWITGGGSASWGSIGGTLSAQTDLATALSEKALASDLDITDGNVSSLSTAVTNISTDLDTAEANITALQTNKANSSDVYLKAETYTQTEINSALAAKMKDNSRTTATSLTLDLATNNIFDITLTASASFSLSNIEEANLSATPGRITSLVLIEFISERIVKYSLCFSGFRCNTPWPINLEIASLSTSLL